MQINFNKTIGKNIRYERQKRNLTIEQLSEILDIAEGFLGLIERGERGTGLKNLYKIANYFSITLDELIITDLSNTNQKNIVEDINSKTINTYLKTMTDSEKEFFIDLLKSYKHLSVAGERS